MFYKYVTLIYTRYSLSFTNLTNTPWITQYEYGKGTDRTECSDMSTQTRSTREQRLTCNAQMSLRFAINNRIQFCFRVLLVFVQIAYNVLLTSCKS
jgi:hypothetical protein